MYLYRCKECFGKDMKGVKINGKVRCRDCHKVYEKSECLFRFERCRIHKKYWCVDEKIGVRMGCPECLKEVKGGENI